MRTSTRGRLYCTAFVIPPDFGLLQLPSSASAVGTYAAFSTWRRLYKITESVSVAPSITLGTLFDQVLIGRTGLRGNYSTSPHVPRGVSVIHRLLLVFYSLAEKSLLHQHSVERKHSRPSVSLQDYLFKRCGTYSLSRIPTSPRRTSAFQLSQVPSLRHYYPHTMCPPRHLHPRLAKQYARAAKTTPMYALRNNTRYQVNERKKQHTQNAKQQTAAPRTFVHVDF